MRRVIPHPGGLIRARRRTPHLGPTPGPGRCHPPETFLEASPGHHPRQAGMDRLSRRPEPGVFAPRRQELGRPVQPRRHRSPPRATQARPATLPAPEHYPRLKQRLDAPPRPENGVGSLRAADVRRILEREFGVLMGRQAVYDLLHRLGSSDLMTRPHHENANPEVQEFFKEIVVEPIEAIAADHPGEQVRVYFQDEARFGTQGTITRVWAHKGSRPLIRGNPTARGWARLQSASFLCAGRPRPALQETQRLRDALPCRRMRPEGRLIGRPPGLPGLRGRRGRRRSGRG